MARKTIDITEPDELVHMTQTICVPISAIAIKNSLGVMDLGDLDNLIQDIALNGQLKPIDIDENFALVCGLRRIMALLAIGMDHATATVHVFVHPITVGNYTEYGYTAV